MTTKEFIMEKIKFVVRDVVREELRKIFADPDVGLELKESAKKRLKRSLISQKKGETFSFEEIVKNLE